MGNATSFSSQSTGARYDTARYGTARYNGTTAFNWVVPAAGYDAMDRLVEVRDRHGDATTLTYDVEGRRTGVTFASTPSPVLAATYDMVGHLLGLNTTVGATPVLTMDYGYDRRSNRIASRLNLRRGS